MVFPVLRKNSAKTIESRQAFVGGHGTRQYETGRASLEASSPRKRRPSTPQRFSWMNAPARGGVSRFLKSRRLLGPRFRGDDGRASHDALANAPWSAWANRSNALSCTVVGEAGNVCLAKIHCRVSAGGEAETDTRRRAPIVPGQARACRATEQTKRHATSGTYRSCACCSDLAKFLAIRS